MDFAADLLEKTGIIVPPGVGYGQAGEGYFRIALSVKKERIQEAIERMKTAGLTYNG
jgi:LL-diaminopimelate aminotransferase